MPQQDPKQLEFFEKAYAVRLPEIEHCSVALRATPYGHELHVEQFPYSYTDFLAAFPVITSEAVLRDPKQFLVGDPNKLIRLYSGGTTGAQKEFYFSDEERVNQTGLSEWSKIILAAKRPLVLYGRWGGIDAQVACETTRAVRSDVDTYEYDTVTDAIDALLAHDAIYMAMGVMSYRTLHFQLIEALGRDITLRNRLHGRQIMLELNSEPVDAAMLSAWFLDLANIFGREPSITVSYTQNDTGLIGLYDYLPDHGDADIRYRISQNRLVEVLDEQGELVLGETGNIVISTFRSQGSVLFRYRSGDQGVLHANDKGELFLSDVRRDENDGAVSLWGRKVSMDDFYRELQASTLLPFQMDVLKRESPSKGHIALEFTIYLQAQGRQAELFKEQFQYLTEAMARPAAALGGMRAQSKEELEIGVQLIRSRPADFEKSWRVRKE